MKTFTLSGVFSFLSTTVSVLDYKRESGFKLGFLKDSLKMNGYSNHSGDGRGIISFISLFILFLFSNFLTAQITLDGNPSDWEATLALPGGVKARIIDPVDNTDNIWASSKDIEPISGWKWTTNGSNDKNNIGNTGYYLDGNKLYFFADRVSNNGDSAIGFWILQGSVAQVAGGTFSGTHVDGDILMISHFVNGGAVAQIQAFRWTGGALDETPIPLPTSGLDARVNASSVASPVSWNYVPKNNPAGFYPENSFFEGFIDLSSVNFNLSVCLGTFLTETRQSQSLDASLEDLVYGRFGSVPLPQTLAGSSFCTSIANSGTITMNSSETGVSYQLKKDSDGSNVQAAQLGTNGSLVWSGLPAGNYYMVATNTTSSCPKEFGRPTAVVSIPAPNVTADAKSVCVGSSVTLTGSPEGGIFSGEHVTGNTFSATGLTAGTYDVTYTFTAANGCTSSANTKVTVTSIPNISSTNKTACEGSSVNLTTGTVADGSTVTYHLLEADAASGANPIGNTETFNAPVGVTTIYMRGVSGANTSCIGFSSFTVTITDVPDISSTPKTACEGSSVNLTTGTVADGSTVSYHLLEADAASGANPIGNTETFNASVGSTTIYMRGVSNANASCVGFSSFTVTITDVPDISSTPKTACEGSSVNLTTGTVADGSTVSYHLLEADAASGANPIGNTETFNASVGSTTIYMRGVSNANASCIGFSSFTVTVTNIPEITVQNFTVCETNNSGSALINLLAEVLTNPDGGVLSFYNTLNDAQNETNAVSNSVSVTVSTPRVFYVRAEAGTTNCYSIASFSVTVNPNPVLVIHNPDIACEGTAVNLTAAAITSGSVLGDGSLSYWTDSEATMPLQSPNAVTIAGTYYIKAVIGSCTDIKPVTVTIQPCGGALCTYTQGYYGNLGGMSCANDANGKKYTTLELISKALNSYDNPNTLDIEPMVIGLPGHSVLISNNDADKKAIIDVLPGGGNSYLLSAGDPHISALPASYLKKGTINNTLLAQTITLGLNIGINSALGNFALKSGTLATAVPQGGCGSNIPMPRSCSAEGYAPTLNEYKYFTIPAVVDLLPNKTVQGLFDMANTALGGGALPQGVTLSALANAVDVINNAFDGCKISMGYDQEPMLCDTSDPQGFAAFEVPIVNDKLTIKYKFAYSSDVTIDVFDLSGNKLCTKSDTNSYLDKEVVIDYDFNTGVQKIYIVRLTTRLGSSKQKVVSSN